MTYVYQWMGMTAGYAFLYGCMLGLMSPDTYLPKHAKTVAAVPGTADTAAAAARIA